MTEINNIETEETEQLAEATGIVKWFNNIKGYGFICSEQSDVEIFAHYSQIQVDGYKTLKPGQIVSFNLSPSDRGFHAHNIKPVDQPDAGFIGNNIAV